MRFGGISSCEELVAPAIETIALAQTIEAHHGMHGPSGEFFRIRWPGEVYQLDCAGVIERAVSPHPVRSSS